MCQSFAWGDLIPVCMYMLLMLINLDLIYDKEHTKK